MKEQVAEPLMCKFSHHRNHVTGKTGTMPGVRNDSTFYDYITRVINRYCLHNAAACVPPGGPRSTESVPHPCHE